MTIHIHNTSSNCNSNDDKYGCISNSYVEQELSVIVMWGNIIEICLYFILLLKTKFNYFVGWFASSRYGYTLK